METNKNFILCFLCFFAVAIFLQSCKKAGEPELQTSYDITMDAVWCEPYSSYSANIVFWDDYVISSNSGQYQLKLQSFHKKTGKPHPAWSDGIEISTYHSVFYGIFGNILIALEPLWRENPYMYAIDLNTGTQLWDMQFQKSRISYPVSKCGNSLVLNYRDEQTPTLCEMSILDLHTKEKRKILELTSEINTSIDVSPVNWKITPNNDTLLFFVTTGWKSNQPSAHCYNLTKKQMHWEQSNILPFTIFPEQVLITESNHVLFCGIIASHCFDIENGSLIWKREYDETSFDRAWFYHQEKFFVMSNQGKYYCYDIKTGNLLWQNLDTLKSLDNANAYKDKVYFNCSVARSSTLACFDISKGTLLWEDEGRINPLMSGLYGDVLIDQQTGYLYTYVLDHFHDNDYNRSLVCIDLNNTPRKNPSAPLIKK